MGLHRRNFFRTAQKKKWEAGSYRNPYFDRGTKSWKRFLPLTLGIFVLLVLLGVFFYAPFLRIQTYTVEGVEFIPVDEIETAARQELSGFKFFLIPKDHILFLSEERLAENLFHIFRLDQLEVERTKQTIEIRVAEKLSRAIWKTKATSYVIDEYGTVLSEVSELAEQSPLTVIESLRDEPISVGQQVLEPLVMEHLFDLLLTLRTSPLQITSLEIDSLEIHFLRVNLVDGYSVYFDPTTNVQEQYERLVHVLRGESADPSTYEYIDVRFGERVYIKNK